MKCLLLSCTAAPFIQIYGPDCKLMISDRCKRVRQTYARKALESWMAAEPSSAGG